VREAGGGRRATDAYGKAMEDGNTTISALQQALPATVEETLGLAWVHPRPGWTALDGDRVRLGRGADQTVRLGGDQVSRQHAEIVRRGKRWLLVDQHSKNGSFQNGRRITETPLADQDVLRFGEWLAVVTFAPSAERDAELVVRELQPGFVAGPAMRKAYQRLETIAPSRLNVILVGETGTGKEFFARSLHALSGRGGLVPVNCASLPEPLADAYLFGYEKGAFTGASHDRVGHFQSAAGGTLFLDELGELPTSVQPKLLRALQEGRVAPLGRIERQTIDVRLVCALQEVPERALESGALRADLFARLNGVQIYLPPLRARREEVLAIFQLALAEGRPGALPALDSELAEWLLLHDWPFNARQVVQCARSIGVEHALEERLRLSHLPSGLATPRVALRARGGSDATPSRQRARAFDDVRLVTALLEQLRETSGNVSLAAKNLRISRQRAYRLLAGRTEVWGLAGHPRRQA
jgi:transcriptional regulator with AAA-type ATPase domain